MKSAPAEQSLEDTEDLPVREEEATPPKNTSYFDMSEEALESQAAELVAPEVSPASSEIPDWLKNMNSVPLADNAPSETNTQTPVAPIADAPEASKKVSKIKPKSSTPKSKPTTQDIAPTLDTKDLPDWLK